MPMEGDAGAADPPPTRPDPPPGLAATEAALRDTAGAVFVAIEATRANAAAAREGVDAAAQAAVGAGIDPYVVAGSSDALLCAIDAAEAHKVVALEAESLVVDAALELVMHAGEEGAWSDLTAEETARVLELVDSPLTGPHEPPALRFVAAAPPSAGLGRVVAPAAVGVGGVSVALSPTVWRGGPSALASVALADAITEAMSPEDLADALEALALRLRAEARLGPALGGAPGEAVPVQFVASVGARAVEVCVSVPEAAEVAGGSVVALERLALGEHTLVPGPASGGGVPRARVCVELRASQTLRGAAAGVPRGEFVACTSLAGLLFVGASPNEGAAAGGGHGGATLVRAYAFDGTPAFTLCPATLGLPPLVRALAFDDAAGLLILALGGGDGGGGAEANAVAAVDAGAAAVRWVSPAAAPVSGVAVFAADGTVLAVEGPSLVARLVGDGSHVPMPEQRDLLGLTGARLAVDASRACVHALYARNFAHRRWKRGGGGGRLVDLRSPAGYPLPPSTPFAGVPPPAPRLQAGSSESGDGAPPPPPPLFLVLPDSSDMSGASLEVRSLPSFALVSRHDLAVPVVGLAAASSGTALVVADAAGDVRVLRWPLTGGLASSSSLAGSAVEAALSRRRAAQAAAAAAAAAALPPPVEMPPPCAETPDPTQAAEASSAASASGPGAASGYVIGPGPWPSLEAKYSSLPQHARFAAVEDADFKELFGVGRVAFDALPRWKRDALRKKAGMF